MVMCTESVLSFQLTSSLGGYVTDPELHITLPTGIFLTDGVIPVVYPSDQPFPQELDPQFDDAVRIITLSDHSLLPASGLPGAASGTSQASRSALISVPFFMTCDYQSGEAITVELRGTHPCGEDIVNFGRVVATPSIFIQGGDVTPIIGSATIENLADPIENCDEYVFDVKISAQSITDFNLTTGDDSVIIYTPPGLDFDPSSGAYSTTSNVDGELFHSPGASSTTSDGGRKEVFFFENIPDLTFIPAVFDLEIPLVAGQNTECNAPLEIRAESKLFILALACGSDFCNDRFHFSEATATTTVLKPDVSITNLQADTNRVTPGIDIDFTLQVDNLPVTAGNDVVINFFCSDGVGGTDAAPIWTETIIAPIAVGSSSYDFFMPDTTCGSGFITAVIDYDEAMCYCMVPDPNETTIPIILPVNIISFAADKIADGQSMIQWVTGAEVGFSHFIVERATMTSDFEMLARVDARGSDDGGETFYQLKDENALAGINLYRLRMVDVDGTETFSKTRRVDHPVTTAWSIIPSVSTTGMFQLQTGANSADDQVTIYGANGVLVYSARVTESATEMIDLSDQAAGMYFVKIGSLTEKIILVR